MAFVGESLELMPELAGKLKSLELSKPAQKEESLESLQFAGKEESLESSEPAGNQESLKTTPGSLAVMNSLE